MSPPRGRGVGIACLRGILLVAMVWLIHQQHASARRTTTSAQDEVYWLEAVRTLLPEAYRLKEPDPVHGGRAIFTDGGRRLGLALRTSPQGDHIIGYAGPNDLLMVFDPQGVVLGLAILASGDTPEHVAKVRRSRPFLESLNGFTWSEVRELHKVDGVSGATLTSLAMMEGVIHRLRGSPASLRFPAPITLEEVKAHLPAAARLRPHPRQPRLQRVLDTNGVQVGAVACSSPTSDNLIGYQGPTDLLLVLDRDEQTLTGLAVRSSYETPSYVDNVREDELFLRLFHGRTLQNLAAADWKAEGVEGVSGATMTSQNIAAAVQAAARALLEPVPKPEPPISWRAQDTGTALVLTGGLVMAWTRLRGRRLVRILFQGGIILYFGFLNGDILSQALLVGWAQHGLPWRLAPGLVLMAAVALLLPLFTRHQVYCHHLCPHGAAQQWLKNLRPRRHPVSHRWTRWLRPLPFLLLAVILVVAMRGLQVNLAALEPFDAYLFQVAGWGSITVAVVGLAVAWWIPMAYCRYGCPTGALLNFLWSGGNPARLGARDLAALILFLLALGLSLAGPPP